MRHSKLRIVGDKIYYGRVSVNLTKNEFFLVSLLIKHDGVVNCSDIKKTIWPGRENIISDNNINQLSSRVKGKLLIAGCEVVITKNRETILLSVMEGGKCKKKFFSMIKIISIVVLLQVIQYFLLLYNK
ncbi:helix-turn-helix domain-containing protein [Enterobacter asburiae]|uniref:helix-turn-helix domain-containing protein n=1 Tax=Enterobacter asburiae TaxID=61645 RepID=UPI00192C4349|nr:helix-turn-helix domain-containing protein [Enterobacter asburiae]MBL5950220.1 helix-turn-helix domain-containing protein [Enterobacter asburiae]